MSPGSKDVDRHLAPDRLQRIATLGPAGTAPGDAQHLSRCPACMERYALLTAAHATYLAAAGPVEVLHDEAAAGGAAYPGAVPAGRRTDFTPPAASVLRRRRAWLALLPAAGLATLAGMAFLRHDGSPAVQDAVRRAMRQDAFGALLYAADLLPVASATRGGPGLPQTVLDDCWRAARDRPESEAAFFWFAGALTASNRVESALAQVQAGTERFPRSARLENLAAIVAFKRNDLPDAERHLQRAIALQPDPAFRFNLYQVLQQLGRSEDAAALRQEILQHDPASAVAGLVRDRAAAAAP